MAEVKFKVGDKVKCVEKGYSFGIENGEIYTVKSISKSKTLINIVNDDNVLMSYFAYRFEKVENDIGKDKFNVGDKVKCVGLGGSKYLTVGKVYEVVSESESNESIGIINDKCFEICYNVNFFEKVVDNMTKTFREVINEIKEGEVWETEDGFSTISKKDNRKIKIEFEEELNNVKSIVIEMEAKCKLKRKQYSFEEAFKAYEKGKEIESLELIKVKYKKIDGVDNFYDETSKKWIKSSNYMNMKEIRGRWYINN